VDHWWLPRSWSRTVDRSSLRIRAGRVGRLGTGIHGDRLILTVNHSLALCEREEQ
jgi:hypothetical protein